MVGVVARKCNSTWMIEVRVKGKFLGMLLGGQEMEGGILGVVRSQAEMSVSGLVKEGLVKCC